MGAWTVKCTGVFNENMTWIGDLPVGETMWLMYEFIYRDIEDPKDVGSLTLDSATGHAIDHGDVDFLGFGYAIGLNPGDPLYPYDAPVKVQSGFSTTGVIQLKNPGKQDATANYEIVLTYNGSQTISHQITVLGAQA